MTDLNKQELRRLAHEASESGVEWLDSDEWRAVMADDWADYVAAAEPGVLIALLDELAQAKCEAGHAIQQKDAAYSECKALRQDAERYRAALKEILDLPPSREDEAYVIAKRAYLEAGHD